MTIFLLTGATALIYSGQRVKDWKNSKTLILHDVEISDNSAKSTAEAGKIYFDKAIHQANVLSRKELLSKSVHYLETAIDINPQNTNAHYLLAQAKYKLNGKSEDVFRQYEEIYSYDPANQFMERSIVDFANGLSTPSEKISALNRFINRFPQSIIMNKTLGQIYLLELKNYTQALVYFKKIESKCQDDPEVLSYLGFCYDKSDSFITALNYFLKVEKLRPNDKQTLTNILALYNKLGMKEKARIYAKKLGMI